MVELTSAIYIGRTPHSTVSVHTELEMAISQQPMICLTRAKEQDY
jgi:hypothetical protein